MALSTRIHKTAGKVLTRNPVKGKKGVMIDRTKYKLVKSAILACFNEKRHLTKAEIIDGVGRKMKEKLDGSLEWPVMAVKLDLEARGIIVRIPRTSPIVHQLVRHSR